MDKFICHLISFLNLIFCSISAIGALRIPNWPDQFEPFVKPKMHSAQWNSSVQLKNKVVAIVGSGASAVQIIPEIVDKVKNLVVYQR